MGGDINIDKNFKNDPMSRQEIKALSPIWDQCMLDCGLVQMNFKDTLHMPGKRLCLLDLYYCTKPEMVSDINNVTNFLSEHDGVTLNLHTKIIRYRPQSEVIRNHNEVNNSNLMNEFDENKNTNIHEMVQSTNREIIAHNFIHCSQVILSNMIK